MYEYDGVYVVDFLFLLFFLSFVHSFNPRRLKNYNYAIVTLLRKVPRNTVLYFNSCAAYKLLWCCVLCFVLYIYNCAWVILLKTYNTLKKLKL